MIDRSGWRGRHPRLARIAGIAAVALMIALACVAARDAWIGFTTGCVRAKYGQHCLATMPWRYAITLGMTCLGSLCSFALAIFFFCLTRASDD